MPQGMTRAEHIKWCKRRAISEMDFTGDPTSGVVSMMSDLRKHPETNGMYPQELFTRALQHKTRHLVMAFINGFVE